MPLPGRALLLIILVQSFVSAQSVTYNKKDIILLTEKADDYLTELKFRESLLYSREALKQAIFIKNDYLIATAYNTIAGNFEELSEYDKAIANYKKALVYATRIKNDTMIGWLNNNLGNTYYFEKKQYAKGIGYYEKALEYAEKTKDTSRLVLTNLNLAWAFFEEGKYPEGYPHLKFINTYHRKFGSADTTVILNMLNGMYNSSAGNEKEADSYFQAAVAAGKKHKMDMDLSYSYDEYSKFLFKNGDFQNAYHYLALHDKLNDEIYDTQKLKKADVQGLHIELDEYKRALDKIETEKQIQSLKLKKSRTIMALFIIVAAVLLILLYTVFKNYNFKKKMNLELTEANEELKAAKEKAEEASQLKSQFVSTISHELRTPLYGVVGITNMILDEHKELAGSTHLNSLKFSAKYLLSLVNDILQINKIEENRLVLENLTFNVSDEINTIKNSLQFIANRNNNALIAEIDTDIPEFVIGDKLRLSQIFMNLVSNALKFTKNGEVLISANLERIEGKLHFIKFMVKDTGIGIAESDQQKIFEKFVQIERKNDDYQGTGLGLSIVKRLISLFGSEIQLESRERKGTSFTFTIGFEVDPDKTAEIINNIEVDLTSGQIFSVLVVEDNKINQMVTKKIIENNNYTCYVVDDGYAAIEILQKAEFDIVLMDINMPGINGFETTRMIREKGITIPVIALTAFGKDEIAEEAISSGMSDVIIKPFEPMTLFRVISNQINKQKSAVI
ncbi:MAG TPA: response regulator [Flavobacterium sp.]|jgi:signal transduction histidine kinase/ActR/RegA family two-component response regulator